MTRRDKFFATVIALFLSTAPPQDVGEFGHVAPKLLALLAYMVWQYLPSDKPPQQESGK